MGHGEGCHKSGAHASVYFLAGKYRYRRIHSFIRENAREGREARGCCEKRDCCFFGTFLRMNAECGICMESIYEGAFANSLHTFIFSVWISEGNTVGRLAAAVQCKSYSYTAFGNARN